MSLATVLLYALEFYVIAGLCVGFAFAIFGVTRVAHMPATASARILIFPGAATLWPYVLVRWLKSGPAR